MDGKLAWRIAITAEAFEAICATLPLGSVAYEHERSASVGYFIWLDRATVNKLAALRGPARATAT